MPSAERLTASLISSLHRVSHHERHHAHDLQPSPSTGDRAGPDAPTQARASSRPGADNRACRESLCRRTASPEPGLTPCCQRAPPRYVARMCSAVG
jgi:hypothetical protein